MTDPLTIEDLQKEATLFLEAGRRYWQVANKFQNYGAVIWVQDTAGFGVLYSRGEYSQQIIQNIERMGPTTHFGALKDD
jgi:hypothetical protein